jgi:hypothetical protein
MPRSSEASKDETVEGRIAAVAHLSAARALVDCAWEALQEHGALPEDRVGSYVDLSVHENLDALADKIMEPFAVANVLQTIEETIGAASVGIDRAAIVRAIVDVRQAAKDDEREPTDDEIYNRPGMEGGIAYTDGPDTRDEHDPSL